MFRTVEDSQDARRNRVTLIGCGGSPAYNAVLSVATSDEQADVIDVATAKAWLYIDNSDFDTVLEMIIPAAREICETYANLSLTKRNVTATIRNDLGGITLPLGPVIGNITVTDEDGTAVADYNKNKPGITGTFTVTYAAGYDTLPPRLKLAWLNQIFYLFENRDKGDAGLGPVTKGILKPLRNV